MILGIFGGTTPNRLLGRIAALTVQEEKLAQKWQVIDDDIDLAIADRAAGIRALESEIAELAGLKNDTE